MNLDKIKISINLDEYWHTSQVEESKYKSDMIRF